MYYPLQVPYLLNRVFLQEISYTEEILPTLSDFAICMWDMQPKTTQQKAISHTIIADGCIDLVVYYDTHEIFFAGMSKTYFHDILHTPARFFGFRLKPGAFTAITGLDAGNAMDKLLPLKKVDPSFSQESFFKLSFHEAKQALVAYLEDKTKDKQPNTFVGLFDRFAENPPVDAKGLYAALHLSARQCQRLFATHFALSPQMVLSILRFQHCLTLLSKADASTSKVLETLQYYDQSHLIKDFKRHIGVTPSSYLEMQKMAHIYNTQAAKPVIMEPYQRKQEAKEMNTSITEQANHLLKKTANVQLAVMDKSGYPVVMAMSLIKPETISELHFATTINSNKAKNLQENNKAGVCIASSDDNISLVGEIEVFTDQKTKDAYWLNWFSEIWPAGASDPTYCVLKFKTKRASLFVGGKVEELSF